MGQAAYDPSVFANEANQVEVVRPLRSVKGNANKSKQNYALTAKRALCALASVALVVLCLSSSAQKTELSQQMQSAQSDLSAEQSEYSYLMNELSKATNLVEIEAMAKTNGLVKAAPNQVTYVKMDDGAVVETMQTNNLWFETLAQGVQAVLGYFDSY